MMLSFMEVGAASNGSVTYQIDPAHDGSATAPVSYNGRLHQRWKIDLGGLVSYPVVDGNLAFVVALARDKPIYIFMLSTLGQEKSLGAAQSSVSFR